MKIILSPAKEMNIKNPIDENWNPSTISQKIIGILRSKNKDELKGILKVNDSVLSQVCQYLDDFNLNKSYKAIDLYNGLSYRWMKKQDLSEKDYGYLDEHLIILSALYGPISPADLIKPYRLDFYSNLKIEEKSLKNIWKKSFNDFFKDQELIINLASDEFSSLLDRKKLQIIDVDFFEEKDQTLKKHSTISKKGRGQMAAFMAKNKVQKIGDIKEFNYDGYAFSSQLSNNEKLVFIKKI